MRLMEMARDPVGTEISQESLALRALGFLSSRPRDFAAFLDQEGLVADDLKAPPHHPDDLAAALEFLITHDGLLLEFCFMTGCRLEAVYDTLRALSKPSWGRLSSARGERSLSERR